MLVENMLTCFFGINDDCADVEVTSIFQAVSEAIQFFLISYYAATSAFSFCSAAWGSEPFKDIFSHTKCFQFLMIFLHFLPS